MEFTPQDIKALRKVLGLSQEAFGKELGVTKLSIINWELGKTEIKKESVKEKLAAMMQEHNLANAQEAMNSIEIVGADKYSNLLKVNVPYETLEPGIFKVLLEKFLSNPDIGEDERENSIKAFRRIILDFEDNLNTGDITKHIWPDAYLEKRNGIKDEDETSYVHAVPVNTDFDISNIISQNIHGIVNSDIYFASGKNIRIEEVFNLSYLPSYIDAKSFIDKINAKLVSSHKNYSINKLASYVADNVMMLTRQQRMRVRREFIEDNKRGRTINDFKATVNEFQPELDEFFDNFGEQLSSYGITVIDIRQIYLNCGYIAPRELSEYIKSGEAELRDLLLIEPLLTEGYLRDDDIHSLEVNLKQKNIQSYDDLTLEVDKLVLKNYLHGYCPALNVLYFWYNDRYEFVDIIEEAKRQKATDNYIFGLEFAYVINMLQQCERVSTLGASQKLLERYCIEYRIDKDKKNSSAAILDIILNTIGKRVAGMPGLEPIFLKFQKYHTPFITQGRYNVTDVLRITDLAYQHEEVLNNTLKELAEEN